MKHRAKILSNPQIYVKVLQNFLEIQFLQNISSLVLDISFISFILWLHVLEQDGLNQRLNACESLSSYHIALQLVYLSEGIIK